MRYNYARYLGLKQESDHIGCYMFSKSKVNLRVTAHITLEAASKKRDFTYEFVDNEIGYGPPEFFSVETLKNTLNKHKYLLVHAEIALSPLQESAGACMAVDFGKLLHHEQTCDIMFIVESQPIPAHSQIVSGTVTHHHYSY